VQSVSRPAKWKLAHSLPKHIAADGRYPSHGDTRGAPRLIFAALEAEIAREWSRRLSARVRGDLESIAFLMRIFPRVIRK